MVQLTRSGPTVALQAEDVERLRTQFDRMHCIHLPRLLDARIFEFVQRRMAAAEFAGTTHEDIGVELCMPRNAIWNLLSFLSNDGRFLQLVQQLTGCGPLGSFLGRVYRMVPGSGHYDSWHSDDIAHRMVGMSVNLSPRIYAGGVFQLRESASKTLVTEVPNIGPGDAIVFRIASHIEHRVTALEGTVEKTAFAGWFVSEPDFMSLFTERDIDPAARSERSQASHATAAYTKPTNSTGAR